MSASLGTARTGERADRASRGAGRASVSVASVSVEELRRAWAAAAAGQFRLPYPGPTPANPTTTSLPPTTVASTTVPLATSRGSRSVGAQGPSLGATWRSAASERVIPVIGSVGSCGATALATALATAAHAAGHRARVVECASLSATGLAAAATAELGTDPGTGRTRGAREPAESTGGWVAASARTAVGADRGVVLERVSSVLTGVDEVPAPAAGGFDLTVVDASWEPGQLLATPSWVTDVVRSWPGVAVTTATGPGLRRLELTLSMLSDPQAWCVAVLGLRRRRWPAAATREIGPLTAALLDADRLIGVRPDRHLAATGLTAEQLPRGLVRAAAEALKHLPAPIEHTTTSYRATQEGTS